MCREKRILFDFDQEYYTGRANDKFNIKYI